MIEVARAERPEDVDLVRDLVREFTRWAFTLDEDVESAPTFVGLEEELARLPGEFGPPEGCLLLARDAGRPAGCVGFKSHGDGVVERKRMYLRPDQRGRGTGAALVERLLTEARAAGARRGVLDSFHTMTGAHRIYRAAGFRDVRAPPGFPEALIGKVVFMEMDLG